MRVLVITPWFPNHANDQSGNFILDSVEALVAAGHSVHVLVTRAYVPGFLARSRQRGEGAIAADMHHRGFGLSERRYPAIPANYARFVANELYVRACLPSARRIVRSRGIDLVHAHADLAGYLGLRVRKETGAPLVTTLHGINTHPRYSGGFRQRQFFESVFSLPERLVVVGEPLIPFVSDRVGDIRHVRVVHNGFRASEAKAYKSRRISMTGETIRFISASNLVEGKGVDTNLRALARLNHLGHRDWHYHIVGGGDQRPDLELLAGKLGLGPQVTFHGPVDHDKVFALLGVSHVFSLPSAPEAFGVAYIEAMACGLLVIGAKGQGPASFIVNGESGFLVKATDDEALARCFERAMLEPELTRRCAQAGQQTAWSSFTWEHHARTLSTVFEEAVGVAAESTQ